MKYTKEEIIERITTQIDECLESHNAEIGNYEDKILNVDIENQTITIKFDFHVVEEDDYVGLGIY
jgi:frataxin-like iron-binding protein CyaY